MAIRNEGSGTQGRSFEQGTHSGTSSAGSMGVGGTGNLGKEGGSLPDASTAAAVAGVHSHRPSPDLLVGSLEADANAEGFAAGERTTELEDGMGDLSAQETTAVGPDLTPRATEHRGASATLINPAREGTAGIPEEVERLEKEKFGDRGKNSDQ